MSASRALLAALLLAARPATAADVLVDNDAELAAALAAAGSGDRIVLAPGQYGGGFYAAGLDGVTLTSHDPADPAVLDAGGGSQVLQLSSVTGVTLEHLVLQNYSANGINIDDGGNWPAGASTHVVLRDLVVRNDVAPAGNSDGIKLSGVDHFHVDRVQVVNWGAGGSAIDPVGCHHGVIENSRFVHASLSGGSAVRPKGGSADLMVRANYLELGGGRALQAGGSTGAAFFRFPPGDSGYEADAIAFAGNTVVGGQSAVSWVNIDGGVFRYNYIERPTRWVMRMLNENVGNPLVETRNGVFADNVVVFGDALSRVSNHDGAGVQEETFAFARNRWFDADNGGPSEAALALPAPETDGVYGADPQIDARAARAIAMPWGIWIVNPHADGALVTVAGHAALVRATPGIGARFVPLAAEPFAGTWSFAALPGPTLEVPASSQVWLAAAGVAPGAASTRVPAAGLPLLAGGALLLATLAAHRLSPRRAAAARPPTRDLRTRRSR